jgi:hypothetical protein
VRLDARVRATVLVLAVVSLTAALPVMAGEVWSHGEASLSISGSVRQIVLYTQQTDAGDFADEIAADIAAADVGTTCVAAANFKNCPAFDVVGDKDVGQGFTRLRLEADLTLTTWLSAFVAYDNEARFGSIDTLEAELGSGFRSDSFLDAESGISEGSHHDWNHLLYRGYIQVETERFELAIGRQRIAWGVGRLWNPIDRFSALPPLSLQPDQTPGIDSIDGRFNFDGFNYLQFVYAPGDSGRDERWAVRLHGVLWDADLSVMSGVFEKAPTVGVDFARNLWGGAMGLEAVFTSPEHKFWEIGDPAPSTPSDYWQVVASFEINLDFGTGVYFLTEYLYNGNGLGFGKGRAGSLLPFFEATNVPPDPALGVIPGPYAKGADSDVFGSSRVVTNSEHQIGGQIGYDLTPELRGDFVTLVDLERGSAAFFPNLRYSPLDSIELTLGVQLFAGPDRSQYGSSEELVYLLVDWFF